MNAKVSCSPAHLFNTVAKSRKQRTGTINRSFPATLNIKERMNNPTVKQRDISAAIGIVNTPFYIVYIFPLYHAVQVYKQKNETD